MPWKRPMLANEPSGSCGRSLGVIHDCCGSGELKALAAGLNRTLPALMARAEFPQQNYTIIVRAVLMRRFPF